ncbi:MAG: TIR domain-containing protein [Pseudomonadota bacterium]
MIVASDNDQDQQIDVFISYKREERGLAVQVARALREAGYSYITDIDLETNEHFGDAIDKRLRRSRVVLVLWTVASAGSTWVRNEARFAVKLNRYLGVELEDVDLALPPDLDGLNREVVANGRTLGECIPEIVAAATKRLGSGEVPQTSRAASEDDLDFAADNMAFENAQRLNSIGSYEAYLGRFPNGFMANEARRLIGEIREKEKKEQERQLRLAAERAEALSRERSFWGRAKRLSPSATVWAIIVALFVGVGQIGAAMVPEDYFGLNQRLTSLQAEVADLRKRPTQATLDSMSAEAQQTVDALRSTITDLEADRNQLEEDFQNRLEASAAETAAALAAEAQARADIETLQDRISSLDSALAQAKTAMSAEEAETATLSAQLQTTQTALDQARACFSANEAELEELIARRTVASTKPVITSADNPPTECDAVDGNRGYWLPANTKDGLQCISVSATTYDARNTELSNDGLKKVAGLTGLLELDLTGTEVDNLSLISGLTELSKLYLSFTQVSDITPLNEPRRLSELYLSGTRVRDITPLSGLTRLRQLSLRGVYASDLTLLKDMCRLHYLVLPNGNDIGGGWDSVRARAAVQQAIATYRP